MSILSKYTLLALLSIACLPLALRAMNLEQKLKSAVCDGDIQRVQELINAGADVNAQGEYRETALMCTPGNKQMVELLIKHGAHVNTQDRYDQTALMLIAPRGHKDAVELLLKHNADTTIKSNNNATVLDRVRKIYKRKIYNKRAISQEEQAEYKEIGRMLLEAYIKQRKEAGMKSAESRAIFDSKIAEVQKLVAQYPGIPAQEIIKHLKL